MHSIAKATIIAALIAAVGSIIVALISVFGNPPEAPPIDVPPEGPALSCPQPPPVEQINVTPQERYVWIQAEWNWDGGKFEFTPGHWESVARSIPAGCDSRLYGRLCCHTDL